MKVAIRDIKILERQRKDFGEINDLANSLARFGLLHPIVIDETNTLIAGHRRILAAMQLGWEDIEVTTRSGLDDLARRELELEENIKRKDLIWHEEVKAVRDLYRMRQARYGNTKIRSPIIRGMEDEDPEGKTNYSLDDAAQELDRSRSAIAQAIALADALDEIPELEGEANRTAAWNRFLREKERAMREELAKRTRLPGESPETKADAVIENEGQYAAGEDNKEIYVRQPIYKAG